jgi:hypothetical protein
MEEKMRERLIAFARKKLEEYVQAANKLKELPTLHYDSAEELLADARFKWMHWKGVKDTLIEVGLSGESSDLEYELLS